jgi:hypothetical protein
MSLHLLSFWLIVGQLKDEPELEYNRMLAFDGNNSLKWVAAPGGRATGDLRIFTESDYFLSNAFVDQYAEEVHTISDTASNHRSDDGDDEEGDDQVSDGNSGNCPAQRWKAAGEKGTWGIFNESGIFASACRHGFILWIVDMIRSGEL